MKLTKYIALGLICSASALHAATVTMNSGSPTNGAGYTFNVVLNSGDNANFSGTVGSWSWEDSTLGKGNGVGWRHQSDWIFVDLQNDGILEVNLSRNIAGDSDKLFPAFTIYRGLTDNAGVHFYQNNGDIDWEEDSIVDLEHLFHHDNSTEESISSRIALPAGSYSIVIGGNAKSEPLPLNQDYTASFNVAAIPEPSTSLLIGFSSLALLRRRR